MVADPERVISVASGSIGIIANGVEMDTFSIVFPILSCMEMERLELSAERMKILSVG